VSGTMLSRTRMLQWRRAVAVVRHRIADRSGGKQMGPVAAMRWSRSRRRWDSKAPHSSATPMMTKVGVLGLVEDYAYETGYR